LGKRRRQTGNVIGFYTDEEKRIRPITAPKGKRIKWKFVKGKLDITGVDVEKDKVKIKVPTEEGGTVEREVELKRHPSPYATVAENKGEDGKRGGDSEPWYAKYRNESWYVEGVKRGREIGEKILPRAKNLMEKGKIQALEIWVNKVGVTAWNTLQGSGERFDLTPLDKNTYSNLKELWLSDIEGIQQVLEEKAKTIFGEDYRVRTKIVGEKDGEDPSLLIYIAKKGSKYEKMQDEYLDQKGGFRKPAENIIFTYKKVGDVTIRINNVTDKADFSTPKYNPQFVEELKAKTKTRKWDPIYKQWTIDASELNTVEELIKKYYPEKQAK
jgi:hypothetical protein